MLFAPDSEEVLNTRQSKDGTKIEVTIRRTYTVVRLGSLKDSLVCLKDVLEAATPSKDTKALAKAITETDDLLKAPASALEPVVPKA